MKATVGIRKFDREMVLLYETSFKSRSFVKQMVESLYLLASQVASYSIKDIGNTSRSCNPSNSYHTIKDLLRMSSCGGYSGMLLNPHKGQWNGDPMYANATPYVEGSNIGVVVGSGNTVVATDDYKLDTKIVQGVGAGELQHGGTECQGLTFSDPNGSFYVRRYFTNNSGGNVTIEEVGIYSAIVNSDYAGTGGAWASLAARDVVAPAVVVADTEILEVTYTIQITV